MNILLPINPDPSLEGALALAKKCQGSLTGLWVIDTRWSNLIGDEWIVRESVRQRFYAYLVSQEREEGEKFLKRFLDLAGEAEVKCAVLCEAGDPAQVVRRLSIDYDYLILPEDKNREVRRLQRASRCPVLPVRARVHSEPKFSKK